MKGDFTLLGTVAMAMLVIPAAALLWAGQPLLADSSPDTGIHAPESLPTAGQGPARQEASSQAGGQSGDQSSSQSDPVIQSPWGESVWRPEQVYKTPIKDLKILNQSTGQVETLSLEQYQLYAMASEMSAEFHLEALKAQGVAALSYALYQAEQQRQNPNPDLKGADLAADPQNRKGYMTEEGARDFYGDQFEYAWARLNQAAAEVRGMVLVHEGQAIAAAYHAISAGLTESAEEVWGAPLPYLTTADSQWDILAPGYKSTASFSQEELRGLLKEEGITLPQDPAKWIEVLERSAAGYVTRVRVGDREMSGGTLRFLLGLRSADFDLVPSGQQFVFEVRGYGHGAGLSQNGADYLGRQGKDYRQILAHYYTGATLARIENLGGTS